MIGWAVLGGPLGACMRDHWGLPGRHFGTHGWGWGRKPEESCSWKASWEPDLLGCRWAPPEASGPDAFPSVAASSAAWDSRRVFPGRRFGNMVWAEGGNPRNHVPGKLSGNMICSALLRRGPLEAYRGAPSGLVGMPFGDMVGAVGGSPRNHVPAKLSGNMIYWGVLGARRGLPWGPLGSLLGLPGGLLGASRGFLGAS